MKKIDLSKYKRIVILTGAGVSVPSGIKPFRGEGGIWEETDVKSVCNYDSFTKNTKATWDFWGGFKNDVLDKKPNIIHWILTEISNKHETTIITQNLDGFHQKSGSKEVIELHGSAFNHKCSNWECDYFEERVFEKYNGNIDYCPLCKSIMRLDAVMFGETIDSEIVYRINKTLEECDLFLSIGTSGTVYPASLYAKYAKEAGACTIFMNPEPLSMENPYFDYQIIGLAEEKLLEYFDI